jgi:hypothetical protein
VECERIKMVKITKTLSLAELQLIRRTDTGKILDSMLFPRILQDCTDLTAEEIFKMDREQASALFDRLIDESITVMRNYDNVSNKVQKNSEVDFRNASASSSKISRGVEL